MARQQPQILVINPGSTSTKLAWFEGDNLRIEETIRHNDFELARFSRLAVLAQLQYRMASVQAWLQTHGLAVRTIRAVAGRGGLLKPLASGTYRVSQAMLDDLRRAGRGEHVSNLGAFLAHKIAALAGCPAFIVDPVSVDEWPPVARLSGLQGMDRECLSHALNTKAAAKRFAREQKTEYDHLRLIVAHLGSGISVSAHENGRMVDVTNSRDEGAFSTERAGSLPVMKLVELCFSGKHNRSAIERMIFREGGMISYLGSKDLHKVLQRVSHGDAEAHRVVDAMEYQIAKEIGAMAAVLTGRVDAILLTGGMAHEGSIVAGISRRVQWIAPVFAYPGEGELRALAEGVLRVLHGEEPAREYV